MADRRDHDAGRALVRRALTCPRCGAGLPTQGVCEVRRFVTREPPILSLRVLVLFLGGLLATILSGSHAFALDVVVVPSDSAAISLLPYVDLHRSGGDEIQLSTAPGADGIVRRIAVKAKSEGSHPDWIVFALKSSASEPITLWIVAPHIRVVGSGVIWPDLGATRIANITASEGESPEKQESEEADVFEVTLEPGVPITFVAELSNPALPELTLWTPDAYKDKMNGRTFFRGIVTGIIGLLALFITVLALIRGTIVFPAAAALAWAVAAYVAIDFGFFVTVLAMTPESERVYRAGAEAVLAATLLVFLFAYLDLNRWHMSYRLIATVWLLCLGGLIALAIVDPAVASGVARISIAAVAVIGLLLIVYLATHGYGRAVLLIPTWLVLFAWVTAASFTLLGRVTGDLAAESLIGGLVLIILLIGFTVMQTAFVVGGLASVELSESSRKALALTGSGDIVFDWDVVRDQVKVDPEVEAILGYPQGYFTGLLTDFIENLHPADRDPAVTAIDRVAEQRRGRLGIEFRIKANDSHYHWFRLRARPLIAADGTVLRLVGTLVDITDSKLSEERLLHDAIHDSLTGLPNRRLLLDRIDLMLSLMRSGEDIRPAVVAIDIDRFRETNEAMGLSGGDALLLALTRRLLRLLRPQDGLARIGGNRFAILLLSEREPAPITALVDSIRKSLSVPIAIGESEAILTASIGISLPDQRSETRSDLLLRNAEIAMAHAKKLGGDRIDVFRPAMRAQRSGRLALEIDLRSAVKLDQIDLFFRPIVRLTDRSICGFEAVPVWNHPRFGTVPQAEFMEVAEEPELIGELSAHILEKTANELNIWRKLLDVDPPFFASVPVPAEILERSDIVKGVRALLARVSVPRSALRIEVSERYLMDHPEQAAHTLNGLIDIGVDLAIGDFGNGYSSLGYLERFPFQSIRLSRGVTRVDRSGVRPAILRSIVSLAHDLDVDLIADGIDSESDTVQFTQIGFALGQGAAFGPALGAAETRKLIKG